MGCYNKLQFAKGLLQASSKNLIVVFMKFLKVLEAVGTPIYDVE